MPITSMSALRFNPLKQYWLAFSLIPILLSRTCITFVVWDSLVVVSIAAAGATIFGALLMSVLFSFKPVLGRFESLVITYITLLLVFTFINGTAIKECFFCYTEILLLCLIVNYLKNDHWRKMLQISTITLSLFIYLGFILLFIFTDWMIHKEELVSSFLLGGNRNQIGSRIIPGIALCILTWKYGLLWKMNCVFICIIGFAQLLITGSMTATSCTILVLLFCLIPSIQLKRLGIIALFGIFLIFQIFVCFNGKGIEHNALAVYIIQDILGKDLTFTNRTEMWDSAGKVVQESPLLGYGWVDTDWYIENMSSFAIGPHNLCWSILITGGILLFLVFMACCYSAFKRNSGTSTQWTHTRCCLLFCFMIFMMMQAFEVYSLFFNFLLLFLIYYYKEIQQTWQKTAVS